MRGIQNQIRAGVAVDCLMTSFAWRTQPIGLMSKALRAWPPTDLSHNISQKQKHKQETWNIFRQPRRDNIIEFLGETNLQI